MNKIGIEDLLVDLSKTEEYIKKVSFYIDRHMLSYYLFKSPLTANTDQWQIKIIKRKSKTEVLELYYKSSMELTVLLKDVILWLQKYDEENKIYMKNLGDYYL